MIPVFENQTFSSNMNPQTNCLLCYRDCTKNTRVSRQTKSYDKSRNINTNLEDQVSVIFNLRQLLEIPKSFCEILLLQNGNPAGWMTSCNNCNELMKKAHSVFKKLTNLQTKYQKLKNKAERILIDSRSKFDDFGCNKTTDHIRNYLFSDLGRIKLLESSKSELRFRKRSDIYEKVDIDIMQHNYKSQEPGGSDKSLSSDQNTEAVPTPLKDNPTKLLFDNNEINGVVHTKIEEVDVSDANSLFDGYVDDNEGSNYFLENNSGNAGSSKNAEHQMISIETFDDDGEEETEDRSCHICQKDFKKLSLLKMHQRGYHYQELNLEPYQCKECNKIFTTDKSLNLHMTMTHTKNFSVFCGYCNAGFPSNSLMNRHVKVTHCEKIKLPCSSCGLTFSDKRSLKHHIARKHTKEFPISCEICGEGCMSLRGHKIHMIKHSKKRNNVCEFCGKRFKRQNSLRDHKRGEHYELLSLEPFKCSEPDCAKTFKSRAGWIKHEAEKHTKKLNFHCALCDQRFYANQNLKHHMLKSHTESLIENNQ